MSNKQKVQAVAVTGAHNAQGNGNGAVAIDFKTIEQMDPKQAFELLESLKVVLSNSQLDQALLDIMRERRNRILSKPEARIGLFTREKAKLVDGRPEKVKESYSAVEIVVGIEGRSEPLRFRLSSVHKIRALLDENVQSVLREYLGQKERENMRY